MEIECTKANLSISKMFLRGDTASISEFVAETDWRNFGSGGWNVEAREIELLHTRALMPRMRQLGYPAPYAGPKPLQPKGPQFSVARSREILVYNQSTYNLTAMQSELSVLAVTLQRDAGGASGCSC